MMWVENDSIAISYHLIVFLQLQQNVKQTNHVKSTSSLKLNRSVGYTYKIWLRVVPKRKTIKLNKLGMILIIKLIKLYARNYYYQYF